MRFDDFTAALRDAGWRDSADAQHEGAMALWMELDSDPIPRKTAIRQDQQLKMLRAFCAKGKAEGWQHLPIDTILAFTHEAAA